MFLFAQLYGNCLALIDWKRLRKKRCQTVVSAVKLLVKNRHCTYIGEKLKNASKALVLTTVSTNVYCMTTSAYDQSSIIIIKI